MGIAWVTVPIAPFAPAAIRGYFRGHFQGPHEMWENAMAIAGNPTASSPTARRRWWIAGGMLGLGIGYFLWYTPYSALAKSLSGGLLSSTHGPIGGLILLPASALGQLVVMPITLTLMGWWKYARRREIGGVSIPFPGRETAMSAFWMALIVGTTTLNFTFPGVSILLVLVLMRVETLIISPSIDLLRSRKIHWYSAVALGLCALSAAVALADVNHYILTIGAVASLLVYMGAYTGRFLIMSRHAKAADVATDRRYFVEEHMSTPVLLVAILAVPALLAPGPLREGFTSFLATPAAIPAVLIGVFYEGLFVFTSLIFLDRREYSFCMPVHVCSSLLAGVAASFALKLIFNAPAPSVAQLAAGACVIAAALMLSYPALRARLRPAHTPTSTLDRRLLLFVCAGNTVRSPMAGAIASAELTARGHDGAWHTETAGTAVTQPGGAIAPLAVKALRDLKIPVPRHESRPLTPTLIAQAHLIYCITPSHRDAVLALAPDATDRTLVLDPDGTLPDPHGQAPATYRQCADQLRTLITQHLTPLTTSVITHTITPAETRGPANAPTP
jgi:protein-tyrosine-phosphatase/NADH:ubiquinone oxidoreductase subunit 6 (subunit J)